MAAIRVTKQKKSLVAFGDDIYRKVRKKMVYLVGIVGPNGLQH